MQLQPKHLRWKIDNVEFDGFIAHEVQAVAPYAVTGDKDAVTTDGGIDPQQLSTGKLIALLVAAVQEFVGQGRRLGGGDVTDVFADIESADVWDADPTIDALQVAQRLHTLRVQVDLLAGRLAPWHELRRCRAGSAHRVAHIIVDRIHEREPDNPALLARRVHEERTIQSWNDLTR